MRFQPQSSHQQPKQKWATMMRIFLEQDILRRGIVSGAEYVVLEDYTRKLFQRGSEIAASRGLILVDTKYEFGKTKSGQIVLIDEIHTPDSSRYFYAEGYQARQANRRDLKNSSPRSLCANG